MTSRALFLAGGGTGGHVFPLLAVAAELRQLAPELELVFIGTDRGIERRVVPAAGYRLELLETLPFRGGGLTGAARGLLSVGKTLPRARALLREHTPAAVLSVGGYAAVPMALAARARRLPLALMEPNMTPGLANRLVGPVAARVYTAFEETGRLFRGAAVLRTGVALRPGFDAASYQRASTDRPLRVLVLGGSQGARSLNDVVAPALSRLEPPLGIVHQVGRGNASVVRARYAELNRPDANVIEFIDDMAEAIRAADLVISRAGMGAIAEICAVGRPSLLVPLPASGDHQLHNARGVERVGAAICVPAAQASVEALSAQVAELARDPQALARMAECARDWGRPKAASAVARDVLDLAGVLAVRAPAEQVGPPPLSSTPGAAPASGKEA